MARAEEAELVADFETVDGWLQPFSGKIREDETPEVLLECDDGTRILFYGGRAKEPGFRPFPPPENKYMNPDLRSSILRYGQERYRPNLIPIGKRKKTFARRKIEGIRSEHDDIAGAGSSGIKADQTTQESRLKRPHKDLGKSTGSNVSYPALDSSAESAGTKAEVKEGSLFKHPSADSSATGAKAEVKPGYSFKHPAANSSASGTKAEVKGGSLFKHPSADPSATVMDNKEVKGESVLKHPIVDPGESNHGLESEPCSTSSSY